MNCHCITLVLRKDNMTEEMDRFINMFWGVLDEAFETYERHKEEKQDSWKTMPLEALRVLVVSEFVEWTTTVDGSGLEYHELIDLILVAMMLADRLSVSTGERV